MLQYLQLKFINMSGDLQSFIINIESLNYFSRYKVIHKKN